MRRTVPGESVETVNKNGRRRVVKVTLDRFTCDGCGEVKERPLDRNQVPPPGWVHAFTVDVGGALYRLGDLCPRCAAPILGHLKPTEEYQR